VSDRADRVVKKKGNTIQNEQQRCSTSSNEAADDEKAKRTTRNWEDGGKVNVEGR